MIVVYPKWREKSPSRRSISCGGDAEGRRWDQRVVSTLDLKPVLLDKDRSASHRRLVP